MGVLIFAFVIASGVVLQCQSMLVRLPDGACGSLRATCPDKHCIAHNLICNGQHDCSDGSDEINCNGSCLPKEYLCTNKRCIPKVYRCDSEDDCGDNSDEINCTTDSINSQCRDHEFSCRSLNQCIPKSFQCDRYKDCTDASDEEGCAPARIVYPPPLFRKLQIGETFEIICTANGVPTPEIAWRFNLGRIPEKCQTFSGNGMGKLTCPDIQEGDQGAYLCEATTNNGSVFSDFETILEVEARPLCPYGFLNKETGECISCFCSNVGYECNRSNLYKHRLKAIFVSNKFITVKKSTAAFSIIDKPIYNLQLTSINGNKAIRAHVEDKVLPYLAMPHNFLGNQLRSYGGYIKYRLIMNKYDGIDQFPDVILKGNDYTLLKFQETLPKGKEANISIGLVEGEWEIQIEHDSYRLATREEIMRTLISVENILIKLQYSEGFLDTTIEDFEMDTAVASDTGLGLMSSVERCDCPLGYSGLSCESVDDTSYLDYGPIP